MFMIWCSLQKKEKGKWAAVGGSGKFLELVGRGRVEYATKKEAQARADKLTKDLNQNAKSNVLFKYEVKEK